MTEFGVLFHGSRYDDIKCLQPRPSKVIDGECAVFATNALWLAWLFAINHISDDFDFGYADNQPYIAELREDAFFSLMDKRAFIYIVEARGFAQDRRLGMYEHEFINTAEVPVAGKFHLDRVYSEQLEKWNVKKILHAERAQFYKENDIPEVRHKQKE
jgi:hypothetical protein